jgi:DNA-directed RNA polymerase specialized sigma24 family protein
MTWEEALSFSDIVTEVAKFWGKRLNDESITEDLYQELMIGLVQEIDLSRVNKNVKGYVKSCAWNMAFTFIKAHKKIYSKCDSLEVYLEEFHFQLDQDGNFRHPERRNSKALEERE